MSESRFVLTVDRAEKRAVLAVVTVSLQMEDSGSFAAACSQLLDSGQLNLTIDLSSVEHVPSSVLSEVVRIHEIALGDGRRLTVTCSRMAGRILSAFSVSTLQTT